MYPTAYLQYLVHFHGDRDYFECHEILEEHWKESDAGNKESIWVGLILLAVSAYHHRRNNFNGAERTLDKAISIFSSKEKDLPDFGLDGHQLLHLLTERQAAIKASAPYVSIHLPIVDSVLLELCRNNCEAGGFPWGSHSDMTNSHIVHRHKLRDRSDVIAERNRALQIKKGNE
ncbi:DUF309 domain-containing protein [Bacillus sp. BRMEA1]|uniref:DUF309 domain-containing protein n=1 Tax=Neobacillus endophyticus TaxID=2738405 RepID=UPI001565C29D|nr:DUF309 domain-containing protein [Neobacillus endophyticus]NRD80628.1 DUF309 domain-containing protein [Neobacillus endophyticus]